MPNIDQIVPPPSARDLLPPLLACLSAASTSKTPPPGLLPLLSPILRQRVQLLSSDAWLSLLSWDQSAGSRLPGSITKINVEPHPASGEIEVEEPDQILYRRSDPETLHARLVLGEFHILPTYLWCTGGDEGNRWLLAELRSTDDADDGTQWSASMGEANEIGLRRIGLGSGGVALPHPEVQQPSAGEEDDDDSYWAAYDQTPGQTPQFKRSPAPPTNGRSSAGPSQSELEYFARYASEVQPALDAHDPDEQAPAPGESTLNGNTLKYNPEPTESPGSATFAANGNGHTHTADPSTDDATRYAALAHPRPSSAASSTSSVTHLERAAQHSSQAEVAVKQHISTDIKSLFRLARASGIEREEFERIVKRELEVLVLLEQEAER